MNTLIENMWMIIGALWGLFLLSFVLPRSCRQIKQIVYFAVYWITAMCFLWFISSELLAQGHEDAIGLIVILIAVGLARLFCSVFNILFPR